MADPRRPPRHELLAALLLGAMIVVTGLCVVVDTARLAAGALAWTAAALLVHRLSVRQRVATAALCTLGLIAIVWTAAAGHPPDWRAMLAANQPLIGMLAAVSFLRLVAPARSPAAMVPTGRGGVWQTMLGLHLFGSVINIPAVDMVGDRFTATNRRLEQGHFLLLSRAYSSAAFWSPFWGAAAAALTYAPAARVEVLMAVGACLAASALVISGVTVTRAFGPRLGEFRGYPLTVRSLAAPVTLVVLVLSVHLVLPEIPIVAIITIAAPLLALLLVTLAAPRAMPQRVAGHALRQLPAMSGELFLFLSAGLLVAGVSPVAGGAAGWLPIATFSAWEAWGLVGIMAAVSGLGLHPVISIAISASVLSPLQPDPTLFAMAGLIAWGLQGAGGPLSGLNVVLQGRYGIDSFTMARWNLKYVGAMLLLAGGALALCQRLAR
ncbi:hypothetical protein OF117_08000 [Geodermatophilus sp. YIM 151500]|uniref:hypothetical protein n=1 Tax=Geodermatophilus sp. YIM 151500 TaxID=2984531 RepID=UPI0021E39BAF|nr:hypothetical protein [Geodermatophilus sp. YIM 151500]MCV2489306.1 hypothetical protein [Geodermatophilus sp. YIM 151500]